MIKIPNFEDKAVLITTSVNRFFISGFRSSLGYLFLVKGEAVLFVDGRYIEAAKQGAKKGVEVRLLSRLSEAVSEMKDRFGFSEIFYEADISVRESESLKSVFGEVNAEASVLLSDELLMLRSIKTDEEISCIKKAQSCAEIAFDNILSFIREGVSEKEIALELEYSMKKAGAEGFSFETIAISGENTSKPHGVPSNKLVKQGEFVTMDFGAVFEGFCSDMTRTVAVGFATDEMIEVYETVLKAQENALLKIKAGVAAKDVDLAAREVIESAGYGKYFTHSTGHGVGIEIHEAPNLAPRNEKILLAGNVVTVEPGIYIEGMFGVRIEDMAKVTQKGAENLTNSKKSLIILK